MYIYLEGGTELGFLSLAHGREVQVSLITLFFFCILCTSTAPTKLVEPPINCPRGNLEPVVVGDDASQNLSGEVGFCRLEKFYQEENLLEVSAGPNL